MKKSAFMRQLRRIVPLPAALDPLTGPGELEAPPKLWFRRRAPRKQKVCYRMKSDALRSFLDWNTHIIEEYGGESYPAGCSEFDPINAKYGIPKSRCAKSIADAVWYALPGSGHRGGPPYCIDQIDLEALNDTAPGRIGSGFRLPPHVEDFLADLRTESHYADQAVDEFGKSDCFVVHRRRGRYFRANRSSKVGREQTCVCRDGRGRFAKCDFTDEVPF